MKKVASSGSSLSFAPLVQSQVERSISLARRRLKTSRSSRIVHATLACCVSKQKHALISSFVILPGKPFACLALSRVAVAQVQISGKLTCNRASQR